MTGTRPTDYALLRKQAEALLGGESDALANSANFVALLYQNIDAINWAGIYVLRGEELVLGPFQGKPACVRIPLDQGVCGTAAQRVTTVRVSDVHAFDGHIACDPDSNSELVVPLMINDALIGVLDIDSPLYDRFTSADQDGVERLCAVFISRLEAAGGNFI